MSTKVKLTKTVGLAIINENEYDIASCCFELYIAMGIYVAS